MSYRAAVSMEDPYTSWPTRYFFAAFFAVALVVFFAVALVAFFAVAFVVVFLLRFLLSGLLRDLP